MTVIGGPTWRLRLVTFVREAQQIDYMIYLSLSRKINQKRCHVTVAFVNESTKGTKQTRLKHRQLLQPRSTQIISKSSLILSADPVDNINFLKHFPEKAYGLNYPSLLCGFKNTHSAKGRHDYLNKLTSIRWFHIWAKNIPWFWLVGWKTPALFPTYKENLGASRWSASDLT